MIFIPCVKKGFVYQKDAEAYLKKLKRIYKNGEKTAVRSYLCDDCGLWHLTSRLHPLEDEIIILHDEIERLKTENKQVHKAGNVEIKRDERVMQLKEEDE